MASNVVVSDKKTYRRVLKSKINQRGLYIMGIILLYVGTSFFDLFISPDSRFWMTLSLAVLTTAILLSVSRVVYTVFLQGLVKGLVANLPLVFLIVAWVLKAVALSYVIR